MLPFQNGQGFPPPPASQAEAAPVSSFNNHSGVNANGLSVQSSSTPFALAFANPSPAPPVQSWNSGSSWSVVKKHIYGKEPPPLPPKLRAAKGEKQGSDDFVSAQSSGDASDKMDLWMAQASSLHPRRTDMRLFFQRLGGIYYTEETAEEAAAAFRLRTLQEELQAVHQRMGKASTQPPQKEPAKSLCGEEALKVASTAALSGKDVSSALQSLPSFLHSDFLVREMITFQDLVVDEHKEKKKTFKSVAGLCRRHCENELRRREQKEGEMERENQKRLRGLSTAVSAFWLKVERVVYEHKRRQMQVKLNEKKERNFNEFINHALRISKNIAGDIRLLREGKTASQNSATQTSLPSASAAVSSSSSSFRIAASVRKKSQLRSQFGATATEDPSGAGFRSKEKTRESGLDGASDEEFVGGGLAAQRQMAEDEELDALLDSQSEDAESGEERDSRPRKDEAALLEEEANESLDEILKRYGYSDVNDLRRLPSEASSQGPDAADSESALSSDEENDGADEEVAIKEPEEGKAESSRVQTRRPRRAASAAAYRQFKSEDAQVKGEKEEGEALGEEEQEFMEAAFEAQEAEDEELDAAVDSSDEEDAPDENDLKRDAEAPLEDLLKEYGFSSVSEFLAKRDEELNEREAESASSDEDLSPASVKKAEGAASAAPPIKSQKRKRTSSQDADSRGVCKRPCGEARVKEAPSVKLEKNEDAETSSSSAFAKTGVKSAEGRQVKRRSIASGVKSERALDENVGMSGGGVDKEMEKWAARDVPSDPPPLSRLIRAKLREYQTEGVEWLFALHRAKVNCILADEMGLGKTLQAIALLAKMALNLGVWGPHLVVVPTSVLENWDEEFKKFLPGFRTLLYYGSAAERQKKRQGWTRRDAFNVCIASYATVVKDAAILKRKEWFSLILDEAQNIKNFNSKRWQTLLTFNTQHRLLLTGTPLQNNLLELWSLMHILMPEVFASHEDFKDWFGDPLTSAIETSRVQRHQRLIRKLHQVLRPYILRRLKKDVEKQMPGKFEHVLRCHLSRRQRCLYDEFVHSREVKELLQLQQYRGMLNALMQLRKVCNHPDLFEPRPIQTPLGVEHLCSVEASIPSRVCLWLQEPWCLDAQQVWRRSSLPIMFLLQREIHESRRTAEAARHLSASLDALCEAHPFKELGSEESVNTYLRHFELTVLRDPLELHLSEFPLPEFPSNFAEIDTTHSPPQSQLVAAVSAAEDRWSEGPQRKLIPSVTEDVGPPATGSLAEEFVLAQAALANASRGKEEEMREPTETNRQSGVDAEREATAVKGVAQEVATNNTGEQPDEREKEKEENQTEEEAPGSGEWFLGGAFGPASVPDIAGLMKMWESQLTDSGRNLDCDFALPLSTSFLHHLASFEAASEETGGQNYSSTLSWSGGLDSITFASGTEREDSAATGPQLPSLRCGWLELLNLQKRRDFATGLPLVLKRPSANEPAGHASRAAIGFPWCTDKQRGEKSELSASTFVRVICVLVYLCRVDACDETSGLSADFNERREERKASAFRFLCYLHFLQQLSPGPVFLGADGRRFLQKSVRSGATYPPFYVYKQIESSEDLFRVTSFSRTLFPRPSDVCARFASMLRVFTCLCVPRVAVRQPRIYLTGRGAITARQSSLSALEDALFLIQHAGRVRVQRYRREHPPTYALQWRFCQDKTEEEKERAFLVDEKDRKTSTTYSSKAAEPDSPSTEEALAALSDADAFCNLYANELQQRDFSSGDTSLPRRASKRILTHTPASYCVTSSVPALRFENDYYEPLLGGWRGSRVPGSVRLVSAADSPESIVEFALRRTQCIFPPRQSIQDDCGKLIVLAELLQKLRAGGHRCIIFTQFSRMLDVLEAWINYQGLTYLRLDGSTKVEHRQRLVAEFNRNSRIFLFISSTRAGGVGINLTGADTVVFYDTDWNPAMDRQAMDRCHRIGQTRDVHVYRLVCAHTIEESIWRKQLQKRLLDEVVVDQGFFTAKNAARKLGTQEVESRPGGNASDLENAEWFSNAKTLAEVLTARQQDTTELYKDRILHDNSVSSAESALKAEAALRAAKAERGAGTRAGGAAFSAMEEFEDMEDRAALRQSAKEQTHAKLEMANDFCGDKTEAGDDVAAALEELPALASYCVKFLCRNKTEALLQQLAKFKAQLVEEGADIPAEEDEGEEETPSERSDEEDGESEMSAAWESEFESEAEGE